MEQSIFEHYKDEAMLLRNLRFKLPEKPSLQDIDRYLEIEYAVEKFFINIGISGGAEEDNVVYLQNIIGGEPQKVDMQKALTLKKAFDKAKKLDDKK